MVYNKSVDVIPSALKHGVEPGDVLWAAQQFVIAYPLGDDPPRELRLGFDTKSRLLEVVVLTTNRGEQVAIHAMPARAKYVNQLLPKGKS